MKRLVLLISGRGSNMVSLAQSCQSGLLLGRAIIAKVIADRPQAIGIVRARELGLPNSVVAYRDFSDRRQFENALHDEVEGVAPDLVVLAGFMRILGEDFVRRFDGRLINIHPSLLPKFPGLKTHEQALMSGEKVHGATVHWVVPALDAGPIIDQIFVPVESNDDSERLAQRVLKAEHVLFPRAILKVLNNQYVHERMPDHGLTS